LILILILIAGCPGVADDDAGDDDAGDDDTGDDDTGDDDTGDDDTTSEPPFSPGELIQVPSGAFEMGGEGDDSHALPIHPVTLTHDFTMGRAEVTNRHFAAMLDHALEQGYLAEYEDGVTVKNAQGSQRELIDLDGWSNEDNHCRITFDGKAFQVEQGWEDHPVNWLTWFGAAVFCNMLGELEALPPLYDLSDWSKQAYGAEGYRLPTEAEWEYAARHADQRSYPWGSAPQPNSKLANYDFQVGFTTEVCSYPDGVSDLGFCDLAGNVLEWTNDRHGDYSADPQTNPEGPNDVSERVIRGGSWNHEADRLLTWDRHYDPLPSEAYGGIGFRVVKIPE